MKSYNKSNYFLKKFNHTQNHKFFVFAYIPITKAKTNNDLRRIHSLINIKRLILPSSFKIVKNKKIQGPRIEILYSTNLNFKKLEYVYTLNAICITLKHKWYIYNLLDDLKQFKTPLDLTLSTCNRLSNKILKFTKSINLSI